MMDQLGKTGVAPGTGTGTGTAEPSSHQHHRAINYPARIVNIRSRSQVHRAPAAWALGHIGSVVTDCCTMTHKFMALPMKYKIH